MLVTERDLARLNDRHRDASPAEVLRFAHRAFGERAAILSSMQRGDTALCHLAAAEGLAIDVLFVDTGVLHAETLATRDALAAAHPGLRVVTLRPAQSFARQTEELGVLYLTKEGQERCCDLRKSAPLLALRGRYDALISPLRRSEGGARAGVLPFGIDPAMNALRVNPFAWLPAGGLEAYLSAHPDVVQNPLHAWGFPTIGCHPCTTPVLPDEPERAGRWRHLAGVAYCGINPIDVRGSAETSSADPRAPGDRSAEPASIELPDSLAALFS